LDLQIQRIELNEIKKKVDLYLSLHRFDAAEKLLKAAVSDHGPLANLCNMSGVTLHKQGQFPEAIKEFRRALDRNPDFVEAGLNLVATLCDLSQYEEARNLYSTLIKRVNTRRGLPNLVLGRIANLHAENGRAYEESGLLQDAIQEYRRALSLREDMVDVRLNLARAFLRVGQNEKSKQELEELVRLKQDSAEGHLWLGIVYAKLGDFDRAKSHWETARQLNPRNVSAGAFLKIAQGKKATSWS
jgi:tetratricopeptide (TPR) repeat protein